MSWAACFNHVDKKKLPWATASASHIEMTKAFEDPDEFERALEKLEEEKQKWYFQTFKRKN